MHNRLRMVWVVRVFLDWAIVVLLSSSGQTMPVTSVVLGHRICVDLVVAEVRKRVCSVHVVSMRNCLLWNMDTLRPLHWTRMLRSRRRLSGVGI